MRAVRSSIADLRYRFDRSLDKGSYPMRREVPSVRNMPSLFVRCHSCSEEFPSGIAVSSEEALHGVAMNGLRHKCPKCGAEGQYFTGDYYVPKGIERIKEDAPDQVTPSKAAQQEEAVKMSGYGVG